jgi:hypothetical protein
MLPDNIPRERALVPAHLPARPVLYLASVAARRVEAELLLPQDGVIHAESALIKLDEARLALAAVRSASEALEIVSITRAIQCYLQQRKESLELCNDAMEIHLRASRRAGELWAEMEKNKGAATPSHDESALPLTLKQMGLDHNRSHRLQRLAAISEPLFEGYIHRTRASRRPLSVNGLLRDAPPRDKQRSLRTRPERGVHSHAAWPQQTAAQDDIAETIVTLVMDYVRGMLAGIPAVVIKTGLHQAVEAIHRHIDALPHPLTQERSDAP